MKPPPGKLARSGAQNSCALEPLDIGGFARLRLELPLDVKQEEWLRSPVRRGILNCTRQWGKSTLTAARAVHRAYYRPGSLVLVVSPSGRQSAEFLRKAQGFARCLGLTPRGDGHNDISLLFPNRSRIVGMPGKDDTVRGFSGVSLLVIDEAARVTDDVYRAVKPMVAASGGDVWLLSTPRGQRGFFWDLWSNGGPTWTRCSIPATECPHFSPDFLAEERRELGRRAFGQEYLCEFLEPDHAVFRRELIERAISHEVPPLFPGYHWDPDRR